MISAAMTRPFPFSLGSSVWVITPSSTKASWARTCDCWLLGKTSMMRLIASGAELVCSVARARWPVSAMVSAEAIVSRSRISPTRITSGSSRRAYLSAEAKRRRVGADLALVDDAVLVAVDELDRIFHRDDVAGPLLVDLVDHRGERRRLAGAGRAGHQHQAARPLRQLGADRRQLAAPRTT